jgi:hypothetical protein
VSKEQFYGAWKLISYQFRGESGQVHQPFGADASGVIMYDASGMMSVQIIRNDRMGFASGDMFDATLEELKSVYEGINSYFGTFSVDEAEKTVTHHVIAASLPSRHASDQVRHYEFSGNRLTLKAPGRFLMGQTMTGVLVWERI